MWRIAQFGTLRLRLQGRRPRCRDEDDDQDSPAGIVPAQDILPLADRPLGRETAP